MREGEVGSESGELDIGVSFMATTPPAECHQERITSLPV